LLIFVHKTFATATYHVIPITLKIKASDVTEEIRPWYDNDGKWYFFIPSYADFNNTVLSPNENGCYFQNTRLVGEQKLDSIELGREYVFQQQSLFSQYSTTVVFLKSADVPTMYIKTVYGTMDSLYTDGNPSNTDRHREPVIIKIYDENGELNYTGNVRDKINVRGNSTSLLDKKPFKLTLSESSSLLGMGEAVNWVLLANGYDETNLRNKLIYDFASTVNMGWTPHCEYVDLYLNGEYNGLYLLSEKIEVAENRLTLNNPDNDYLLERKRSQRITDSDNAININDDNLSFKINYPLECDEQKLLEIQNDVRLLNTEIESGDLSRIDLDSWVRRFLIDEVFINLDAANGSSFYHFDSATGKYIAGPIWDYDISSGNDAGIWEKAVANAEQIYGLRRHWYKYLYQNKEFYVRLKEIYREEFLPAIQKMLAYDLPFQTQKISSANANNSIRWDEMFKGIYSEDRDLAERISQLSKFMNDRLSYLEPIWCSDKEYENVSEEENVQIIK